jgi:hypothetical protein
MLEKLVFRGQCEPNHRFDDGQHHRSSASIELLGRQIMAETPETNKPDFRNGFPIRNLSDGSMLLGHADREELVLGRRGDELFAIGERQHRVAPE